MALSQLLKLSAVTQDFKRLERVHPSLAPLARYKGSDKDTFAIILGLGALNRILIISIKLEPNPYHLRERKTCIHSTHGKSFSMSTEMASTIGCNSSALIMIAQKFLGLSADR